MSLREVRDLNPDELDWLRLLNAQLLPIQKWGEERAVRCLRDYLDAGGAAGMPSGTNGE